MLKDWLKTIINLPCQSKVFLKTSKILTTTRAQMMAFKIMDKAIQTIKKKRKKKFMKQWSRERMMV